MWIKLLILLSSFTATVVYVVIGALIFMKIENTHRHEASKKTLNHSELNQWLEDYAKNFSINSNVTSNDMKMFYREYKRNLDLIQKNNVWDLATGIYYCLQTITTIGYGDVICNSNTGKTFTMLYVPFGITLFSIFLLQLTRTFLRFTRTIHKCLPKSQQCNCLANGFYVIVVLVVFYLFFGLLPAYIICYVITGWNMLDAHYFLFVTLTTIGYGDYSIRTLGPHFIGTIAMVYMFIGVAVLASIAGLIFEKYYTVSENALNIEDSTKQIRAYDVLEQED